MVMADDKREIKLYCPAMAKLMPYVVNNGDRIDIGGIAKVLELEPATLKINGHFIGRGPDLVAPSVTWKALISFFSQRGLPTGADERSPLIVRGKILKPGNKRTHEPTDDERTICHIHNSPTVDSSGRTQNGSVGSSKRRKLGITGSHGDDMANELCHKRKQHFLADLENLSLMKKLKIDEPEPSKLYAGQNTAAHTLFSKPLKTNFPCSSYLSQKMKRIREEETVVAVPPKRIVK